jgi:hypothetical protein
MTTENPNSDSERASLGEVLKDLLRKKNNELTLLDVIEYIRVVNYNFVKLQETLSSLDAKLGNLETSLRELIESHKFIDEATQPEKTPKKRKKNDGQSNQSK